MSRILLTNAMILTMDPAQPIIESGHVLVEGARIAAVGAGDWRGPETPERVIACRDRLVAPGLVNAHTHSQSSTMAGFGDRLSHPAFMWLTQAHTARRSPDETRLAALLTAYGLITSGTTGVIDHFPGQRFTGADLDAVFAAWEETGLRAVVAMRFFDGAFSDIFPATPLPEDLQARMASVELLKPQPTGDLAALMEAAIRRWHGRPRLSAFPAPSNPDRCTDEALLLCADLAERFDTGLHTHLLETRKQAELARARYGASAVSHMETLGILSDRWSCAHGVWLDDDDIALLAARGATIVLNPESNDRLGVGRARAASMLRCGVPLALGTDGCGANDNLVLHEAMRATAVASRADEPERARWLSADDVLAMATRGGARAMRQPDLGAIKVGWKADLAVYRLDAPWWTPLNEPAAQMVFAETGASVETVLVDGRMVMEDRRILTFDVEAMLRETRAMAASLRRRNADLFAVANDVARLTP